MLNFPNGSVLVSCELNTLDNIFITVPSIVDLVAYQGTNTEADATALRVKYKALTDNINTSSENLISTNFANIILDANATFAPIIRKCVFVYKTINGEVDNWKKDIVDLF